MRSNAVLYRAFSARISAVEALLVATVPDTGVADRLRTAADDLDTAGPVYGRASTALTYAAFAELLRTIAMLIQWRDAVLNAEADADRFLRAAKARHQQWQSEYGAKEQVGALAAAAQKLPFVYAIDDVAGICTAIAATPLPIGVFSDEPRFVIPDQLGHKHEISDPPPPPELAVAFLSFLVDSTPAQQVHYIEPDVVHDLEIEVRVSRWPEAAERLVVTSVSIEPRSSYDFPQFEWQRPSGQAPFVLRDRGRAVLMASQGLSARPFEFKYAASFMPIAAEQPVAVVGHRTLLIEGIDIEQSPLTGYRAVDLKLIELRNELRRLPLVTPSDLDSALKVLLPLASLSARAINDSLFRNIRSEAEFQVRLRDDLRRVPALAADLEEHPSAAGGFTDLSFRGIPIELKFEARGPVQLIDCERCVGQSASYAVARGKRIALLCVLENSAGNTAPAPAEEGIGLLYVSVKSTKLAVATVIIQGNLPRPSDLSR
jgi:hypothetical protein